MDKSSMDPPTLRRPELSSPQRLTTTQPILLPQNQDAINSESPVETLYSHPDVKIISFTASGRGLHRRQGSSAGFAFEEEPGSLSWSSHLERTIAVGPVKIYRAPGSVAFLSCGSALQPMLPKSQCWCVDEMGSKFVLQIRRPQYWRIELPMSSPEEQSMSQAFKEVLDQILQFEKTHCPFQRPFTVEIPEQPDTPTRKKPWTPVSSAQVLPPEQPGNSPITPKRENLMAAGDETIDPSPMLDLHDSKLMSNSHPSLSKDTTDSRDMSAAASPSACQSYNNPNKSVDTTFASIGAHGSFAGRTGLPEGRIAVLRDIFERLFSISAESRFHIPRPQLSYEAGPSNALDAETDPSNATPCSSATGLPATSRTAYGVATVEPRIWMLHQGSWRLSAWMENRLRRATQSNFRNPAALPPELTVFTSPPSTDPAGLGLPRDGASSLASALPIESQCSSHGASLWHSFSMPLPPSPPMSRPESPSDWFHASEEVEFIQSPTGDAEGDSMVNRSGSCYAGTNQDGGSVVLEESAGISTGQRQMEHQDYRDESRLVQHAGLLQRLRVLEASISERRESEASGLGMIRKHPMAIIYDILLGLPNHLIRFFLKVAVKIITWGWKGQVFDDNHGEQSPVQQHSLGSDSSDRSSVDNPTSGGRGGELGSISFRERQIWDVD